MKRLFPSLPENPVLPDVFRRFPATIRPLLEYHDLLLRNDSDLSVGEREMIAAYVSSLNACTFCMDGHVAFARAFGVDPDMIAAMLADLDSAEVPVKLRPILHYVRQLTLEPAKMTESLAHAVYDAGWSEEALFDAVQTCALFNFMNRIVEGTGVVPRPKPPEGAQTLPTATHSYLAFGKSIGVA